MIRRLALALLGLLLAGGLTLAFLARGSFRQEPVEVPTGWSAKALEDRTLVLSRWLATQGWAVRRDGGGFTEAALPPGGLVILLQTGPAGLGEADADRLLAWVREGGNLLVDGSAAPLNDARGTAPLFRRLGAELISLPEAERTQAHHTDRFSDEGVVLAIQRSPEWRIRVERADWAWWMGTKSGEVLVRRPEGKGSVQLASDLSFLYNDTFPELDHAAWLARILPPESGRREAVIWSRPADPSFLAWLWRRAWTFLLACGVLLTAWLWKGLWRFGPWLPEAPTSRRSLLEHLVATGRFLWRQGGGPEALVAACRAAVLRRATRLHPAFPTLAEGARWAYLAARSGLPESEIAEALDERPGTPPERLGRRLHLLLHLRHRLSPR